MPLFSIQPCANDGTLDNIQWFMPWFYAMILCNIERRVGVFPWMWFIIHYQVLSLVPWSHLTFWLPRNMWELEEPGLNYSTGCVCCDCTIQILTASSAMVETELPSSTVFFWCCFPTQFSKTLLHQQENISQDRDLRGIQ